VGSERCEVFTIHHSPLTTHFLYRSSIVEIKFLKRDERRGSNSNFDIEFLKKVTKSDLYMSIVS